MPHPYHTHAIPTPHPCHTHLLVVVQIQLAAQVVMGDQVSVPVMDIPVLILEGPLAEAGPALLLQQSFELPGVLLQVVPRLLLPQGGV